MSTDDLIKQDSEWLERELEAKFGKHWGMGLLMSGVRRLTSQEPLPSNMGDTIRPPRKPVDLTAPPIVGSHASRSSADTLPRKEVTRQRRFREQTAVVCLPFALAKALRKAKGRRRTQDESGKARP